MIGNCEKCPLPEIVRRQKQTKNNYQIARANSMASSTPTEAMPHKQAANEAAAAFKTAQAEYIEFIEIWDGICPQCKYGA